MGLKRSWMGGVTKVTENILIGRGVKKLFKHALPPVNWSRVHVGAVGGAWE